MLEIFKTLWQPAQALQNSATAVQSILTLVQLFEKEKLAGVDNRNSAIDAVCAYLQSHKD